MDRQSEMWQRRLDRPEAAAGTAAKNRASDVVAANGRKAAVPQQLDELREANDVYRAKMEREVESSSDDDNKAGGDNDNDNDETDAPSRPKRIRDYEKFYSQRAEGTGVTNTDSWLAVAEVVERCFTTGVSV
eukprot:5092004-Pleurochrysis_carterae.AAC.2